MNNHLWIKEAIRLLLSVVVLPALLGPPAAKAQCKANQNGCENEGAACQTGGGSGRCKTSGPKNERECNCVGRPQQQLDPPIAAVTALLPGTVNCSATAVTIKTILRQYLVQLGIQNPDIRTLPCPSVPNGASSRLSVLIWSAIALAGTPQDLLRNKAPLPDIIANDGFAVFFADELLTELAQSTFESNGNLRVVPGYPSIHLTGISLAFPTKPPGNIVQTIVSGYDDQPFPSVSFTDTISDQLVPREDANGQSCSPVTDSTCGCVTTSSQNVNTLDEIIAGAFGVVAAVISGVLATEFPPLITLGGYFVGNDLSAALHQPTEASTKGAGCTAYQTLPDQIAFPQTGGLTTIGSSALALAAPITGGGNVTEQKMKLMLTYQSVNQGDSGVAFHATGEIVPRTPAVQIVGPSFVIIYKDQTTASATYGVEPMPPQAQDFYGLRMYAWSGDPNYVQISEPGAGQQIATITFNGASIAPGASITQTIQAQINDSEGSFATATLSVQVTKSKLKGPPRHPRPR